jgi:4-amino-4-deoxy-L-arabinose transferase-like glycosyltransferase
MRTKRQGTQGILPYPGWYAGLDRFGSSAALSVLLITTIAFVTRIVAAALLPAEVEWHDGHRYVLIAQNLVEGRGFGSLQDIVLAVPTLPLFIASIFGIFGEDFFALRVAMACVGTGACVIAYFVAKRVFDATTGLLAGIILALYPYLIYLSALFEYPQPLFVLMMVFFFAAYYRWRDRPANGLLVIAGLSLGLAVLTVPTALIFLFVSPLLVIRDSWGPTLRNAVVLVVAASLPIAAWSIRNYQEYDRFVLVNVAGGWSLWQANNESYWLDGKPGVVPPCAPGYEAGHFCVEFRAMRKELQSLDLTEVERILKFDKDANEAAWRFITSDLYRTAALSLRKFWEFWSPLPNPVTKGEAQGGGAAKWISIATYVPLLLLGLAGLWLSRSAWKRLLPFYLFILAMSSPYYLFMPTTRYRLPIDFVLAIFAAYAVVVLLLGNGSREILKEPARREPSV